MTNPSLSAIPREEGLTRSYVRLFLAITVGAGVALAPYLGATGVPGFRALYSVLPVDIRDLALALSTAAAGLAALRFNIYSTARADRMSLRKWFDRWFILTAVLLAALAYFVLAFTVPVDVEGTVSAVRFTVGPGTRPIKPPCTADISDSACIRRLTLDPSSVRGFWGDRQVTIGQAAILATYVPFICSLGAAVGIAASLQRKQKRGGK